MRKIRDTIAFPPATFGLGLGAFGADFEDAKPRFGEFLAVDGSAAYLPTDGTNVPDFMVSSGDLVPELNVLYGLRFEGGFTHQMRFETANAGSSISLAELVSTALQIAGAPVIGMVMVAESAGLVGAALRRSPAAANGAMGVPFQYPEVRSWISFLDRTTLPAIPRTGLWRRGRRRMCCVGFHASAAWNWHMARGTFSCCGVYVSSAKKRKHRIESRQLRHYSRRKHCRTCCTCSPIGARRPAGSRASSSEALAGSAPRPRSDEGEAQMSLLIGTFTIGCILSLLALGVFISFRIFAFPDITADGSVTLGAAVAATLMVHGTSPPLASLAAFAAGMLAGACTGTLYTRFKINSLLSGILVMTALYSINLHIMGKSNIPLLSVNTLVTQSEQIGLKLMRGATGFNLAGWEVSVRDASVLGCSRAGGHPDGHVAVPLLTHQSGDGHACHG